MEKINKKAINAQRLTKKQKWALDIAIQNYKEALCIITFYKIPKEEVYKRFLKEKLII